MRISKVYTRTGDDGTTRLGNGKQVSKHHLRVQAYGEIDELNAILGLIRAESPEGPFENDLAVIQNELFNVGGELAMPESELLKDGSITQLEEWIDAYNESLPALKEFILPGGSALAADLHLARTVCRRAERSMVQLHEVEPVRPRLLKYVNRLSDYFFVIARKANQLAGGREVFWQKPE